MLQFSLPLTQLKFRNFVLNSKVLKKLHSILPITSYQ